MSPSSPPSWTSSPPATPPSWTPTATATLRTRTRTRLRWARRWCSTPVRTVPRTSPTSPRPGCTASGRCHRLASPTCSPSPLVAGNRSTPTSTQGSAPTTPALVFGADRRVVLTHSANLHTKQAAGFDQTLAKTTRDPVSYTHLRAHETDSYLVCRLLLEK